MVAAPEGRTESGIVTGQTIVNPPNAPVGGTQTITSASKPSTTINLALNYANGPLGLGFGYEQGKIVTDSSTVTANPAVVTTSASATTKHNTWNIGASYDFGVVKPFINYANGKSTVADSFTRTAVLQTGFGNAAEKRNVWTLGLTAPVGTGLVFAEYATGKSKGWSDSDTVTVAGVTTVTNNLAGLTQSDKSNAFSVGYRYPLSKRTWVQAAYGQLKTTQESTLVVAPTAANPTASDVTTIRTVSKNSGLAMTLSHTF